MASNFPNVYLEMIRDDKIVQETKAKKLRRAMDDGHTPRHPIFC